MAISLAILAYDGCLGTGITGPLDVFKIANTHRCLAVEEQREPIFSWQILSVDGKPVRTSSGLMISVDGDLSQAKNADVVFLPGVDHARVQQLLEYVEGFSPVASPLIRELYDRGTIIAASCSGSFFLAESGLLDYRQATTSWWLANLFSRRYPTVKLLPNELVTEQDNLYCSGAITAYLHLCVRLIDRFAGRHIASSCAKTLLIHANANTQAPFVKLTKYPQHEDEVVKQAIHWMENHLAEQTSLDTMTEQLAVSKRTFIRRFNQATGVPPNRFWQQLRIDAAKKLLETSELSIDQITEKVGYNDVSSFRRLFKREVDLSPVEYRNRFAIGR